MKIYLYVISTLFIINTCWASQQEDPVAIVRQMRASIVENDFPTFAQYIHPDTYYGSNEAGKRAWLGKLRSLYPKQPTQIKIIGTTDVWTYIEIGDYDDERKNGLYSVVLLGKVGNSLKVYDVHLAARGPMQLPVKREND